MSATWPERDPGRLVAWTPRTIGHRTAVPVKCGEFGQCALQQLSNAVFIAAREKLEAQRRSAIRMVCLAQDELLGTHHGEFQLLGDSGRERFCLIRELPSEIFANAAEVTVGRSLLINGALEIQHLD